MKKNKLVNIFLIMIIVFSVLFATKETLAANNINMTDLTGTINNVNNTTNGITENTENNTTKNTTNNVVNNIAVLTTNNTSNYDNTNLPHTGIEDSISGVVLVVILGISAIYAYNRIQYYKNI